MTETVVFLVWKQPKLATGLPNYFFRQSEAQKKNGAPPPAFNTDQPESDGG